MSYNAINLIKNSSLVNKFRRTYKALYVKLIKIRGRNNSVFIKKNTNQSIKWNVEGNNNYIKIGSNCSIENLKIFIRGNNHSIEIGDRVVIEGGELWLEDHGCSILIGNDTTIGHAHLAVTEPGKKIKIGIDCMLSSGIEFRTGDSHSIFDLFTNKRINHAKDIIVGNHVWIASRVVVLKGVNIGSNSIIGTGSIVTKSLPESCAATGVPARVVKENISWTRERIYQ